MALVNKPKYIINFVVWAGEDERQMMYFENEDNAIEMYRMLEASNIITDCYLSEVYEPVKESD